MRRAAIPALLAVALIAAGCGGGGGSDSSSTPSPQSTAAAGSSDSASSSSGGSSFCTRLQAAGSKLGSVLSGAGGASGSAASVKQELDQLAAAAPASIRQDVQVVDAQFSKVVTAIKSSGVDVGATTDPEGMAKLQQVLASVNSSSLAKANTHIAAWIKSNC
jgi:hypothetical protein